MERVSLKSLAKNVQTEAQAYEFMEQLRWPNGPVCPHCNNPKAYFLTPKGDGRKTNKGKVTERRVVEVLQVPQAVLSDDGDDLSRLTHSGEGLAVRGGRSRHQQERCQCP